MVPLSLRARPFPGPGRRLVPVDGPISDGGAITAALGKGSQVRPPSGPAAALIVRLAELPV